jgi:probable HAF family extracellular repeat protein
MNNSIQIFGLAVSGLRYLRTFFKPALAGLAATVAVEAQPHFQVTDLGVLPGFASSTASGLNDRGEVVGYCSHATADFHQVGFVWRNGVMTGVGKLTGGNYSFATAINLNGAIAGDGDTGNDRPQSWVTGASGLINIFPNNGGNTHAVFIDENDTVGGYYTTSLSGGVSSWKGAIWTRDPKDPRRYRTLVLPVLLGGLNPKASGSLPNAFNRVGQAAGYAENDRIGQHACFWNNDAAHSIVDLGVFPGDWSSLAWGINDVGQVAGESHPPFGSRPIVWDNDAAHTPLALPLLPGDNYGSCAAINNVGQVIGISALAATDSWNVGPTRCVVWRDGGVFDLQLSLDPVSGANWTLDSVAAINNLGQIVGAGHHNGEPRAFLLTPLP